MVAGGTPFSQLFAMALPSIQSQRGACARNLLFLRGQRLVDHINLVAHVLAQDAAEARSITRLEGS